MQTLENIYKFNTRNFCVQVDAMEEINPDFSFDETGETQEMVNRGDWLCFSVKTSVSFNGNEIASDYLGNCIRENFRDFRDHLGSRGSYFTDMIRQAISDARKEIATMQSVKLMAAAPELLSALQWFADELPGIIRANCPYGVPLSVSQAHDRAVAVIAKAEGRTE